MELGRAGQGQRGQSYGAAGGKILRTWREHSSEPGRAGHLRVTLLATPPRGSDVTHVMDSVWQGGQSRSEEDRTEQGSAAQRREAY